MGVVDAVTACSNGQNYQKLDQHATGTGNLYEGVSYGIAATALSLGTNLFATATVAFKAWYAPLKNHTSSAMETDLFCRVSRRVLKRYVVAGTTASQVEKVLSLLVESGALYCAIWVSP